MAEGSPRLSRSRSPKAQFCLDRSSPASCAFCIAVLDYRLPPDGHGHAVMADPEGSRKLEAILAADVAGYSRLMQDDDEATVATLEAYRAVFREKIQAHRGRVVDMAGDSVLAVFEAATGAVRAAFEIQGVLAERNEALPEARRMRFRIGVNLGEVIERPDGTVYGDGVNIAARLESIGEPGGVTRLRDGVRSGEEPRPGRLRLHRRAGGQEHR